MHRVWPAEQLRLDEEVGEVERERRRRLFWREGRPWEQYATFWGGTRTLPEGRWAIRSGTHEDHWARLDALINSDKLAPVEPPANHPISSERTLPFVAFGQMNNPEYLTQATWKYARDLRKYVLRKQRWRNRAQAEFWVYVQDMHHVLSHLTLAHARSDLRLVHEAILGLEMSIKSMQDIVDIEEEAMERLDTEDRGEVWEP